MENKNRHDLVGKMVYKKLYKEWKFDDTTKWYVHKLESLIENKMHKNSWYFEIKLDYVIPARRPDQVLINKIQNACSIVQFAVPADHRMKINENAKRDKYLDLTKKLKKLWNMRVTVMWRGMPPREWRGS